MTILLILVCCSKRYEWPHQKGRTLLRSQDYYHSGVRWRPGVGGWPIQNTTEWAAAAAPKTVAKAITNNYKSPTDWILFEIKVAPTEYYLLTWSAGCWASGGPPACCPPPSPRRGSLFHITTSPINSFSEISRNTINSVLLCLQLWGCFTLHCPPPSVPRPVPRTVSALGFPTQKQSVPDPATQNSQGNEQCRHDYEHVLTGHTIHPRLLVPKWVSPLLVTASLNPPTSGPGSWLRIGDVRSRPAADPGQAQSRERVEVVPDNC